jgi:hypothetical protein
MKLRYLIFLIAVSLFTSCEFEEKDYRYNLGADFINDPTRVIMIDTLTVKTYTTAIDSIVTSQKTRFLAGRSENSLGIRTTCEAYFRLDPSAGGGFHESTVFDSACFILYPDGYNSGDTTKVLELAIHSLTEDIAVDDETEYIYNNKQFACEPSPLVTFSVDLNNEYDSISIRLPGDYERKFFDMAFNEDSILLDKDLFNEIYKGYVIKAANQQNSFIIGFNAVADSSVAPKIRIYYHDNTPNDDLYFDYTLENFTEYTGEKYSISGSEANSFASNYIMNDYSNSKFKNIKTGTEKLSSSETDDITYMQGGLNLRTRIEIPYIDNLYALGIGSIIKAELTFEPIEGTYQEEIDLPSSLEVFLIDSKNRSYGQMSDIGGKNAATAVLNYNDEFKNQTYYTFDVTRFVRDEYISKGDPEYSLLMTLPQSGIASNVEQLMIGSQEHPSQPLKLKLYLTNF